MGTKMACEPVKCEIGTFPSEACTVIVYQMRFDKRDEAVVAQGVLNSFLGDMDAFNVSPFTALHDTEFIEAS